MTFVLKEFSELKKHFADTVAIFLARAKVKSLEELSSPRKDQLLFLMLVLDQLDEQIKNDSARNLGAYASRFYAAMLVVNQDARNNLSTIKGETEAGSKLIQRLNDCLNITEENKPELKQRAAWHRGLNELLNVLYESHDSRQGFNKNHPFVAIKHSKLLTLVKLSYELEEKATVEAFNSLAATGKSKSDPHAFKPFHRDPHTTQAIVEKFKSFDELQTELRDLINKELGGKDVAVVSSLARDRAIQLQFLQTIAASLACIKEPQGKGARENSTKDMDKVAVLAGAMHIVRSQIAASYSKDLLTKDDINSTFVYSRLSAILNTRDETPENIYVLVSAANYYVQHLVIDADKTGDSIRAEHSFSKITGFDLPAVMKMMQEILKTCRITAFDDAIKAAYPKEPSKSVMGYIGSFWPSSSKPAAKPTEDDEEELSHEVVGAKDESKTVAVEEEEELSAVSPH